MIPVAFEYTRPSTVDEAVAALGAAGEDGKVLAGGQTLIPVLRLRLAAPTMLVDLGGIGELCGVREDGDALVVGAMTTYAELIGDPLVVEHAPLIAQTAALVGDRQVRHLGTIGGSLAHADPAGDLPAVALALGATMIVAGVQGQSREVAAADFFADFLTSVLAQDEVLVEVRVPKAGAWGTRYEKFNRMAQAWAIVGVAAAVRREDGQIAEARVALSNMGPTPVRATAVEQALVGQDASAAAIGTAAEQAAQGTAPVSDLNASAEYRTHLAKVLVRRALTTAAGV